MQTKVHDEVKTGIQHTNKPDGYAYHVPRANIWENENGYVVLLEMPGVSRDTLKVEVEKGHLVVQGYMNAIDNAGKKVYEEISKRYYRRAFKLSDGIEVNGIRAKWNDGILEVNLAKKPILKAREIEIHYN